MTTTDQQSRPTDCPTERQDDGPETWVMKQTTAPKSLQLAVDGSDLVLSERLASAGSFRWVLVVFSDRRSLTSRACWVREEPLQ